MSTYGRSTRSWAEEKHGNKKTLLSKIFNWLKKLFTAIKNGDWGTIIRQLILLALIGFFTGSILFLILFAWYSQDLPDPNSLTLREVPQSTKIFDRSGEHLLYEISAGEKRTLVTLETIPDYLEKATITAEDRKFYEHGGIDFKGIARAIFVNIITLNPTGQGASTITQQLVKNAILTNEKSIGRKVKEIMLSFALEKRYTKDQILQLYLNEIPYGSTNYGAESAAQAYYHKHVQDISLAEAATIAALPQAPTTYLNHQDKLMDRRNWILHSMKDLGYISEADMKTAISTDTKIVVMPNGIQAPHFVLWVKEQLVTQYGEKAVEQGGLTVITTLDYDKQKAAEEAVSKQVTEKGAALGFNNAGLISLDPQTGDVLAMVGSADYFNNDISGQVNITLQQLQPGSSFKPIIYAAAFEKGYNPNTLLWDVDTVFSTETGPYQPKNYDHTDHGLVSIRKALQGSLNIPAVKTLYLVGVENGLQFAERMGYTTFADRSRFGLAIVLGGGEVKPIEHAAAYAIFAADGVYHTPKNVLKVTDGKNNILFEQKPDAGTATLDPNITHMISNVLSDDAAREYIFGRGGSLTLPDRPVAAKTGTTNDSKDAWAVGYTPDIVTAVWAGNTNGTVMTGGGGSQSAAPIWHNYMVAATKGTPVKQFPAPTIAPTGKQVIDGQMPTTNFTIDSSTGLLATENTPVANRIDKSCGEYHNILTYVDPANPTGPAPADPKSNPAWQSWEDGVVKYITTHNANLKPGELPLESCTPPTEYDNVHNSKDAPSVTINSPSSGSSVGRSFAVSTSASGNRSITKTEYYIDTTLIQTAFGTPGDINLVIPPWVGGGNHQLKVISYDSVNNSGIKSLSINLQSGDNSGGPVITNPYNQQQIGLSATTYKVAVEINNLHPSSVKLEAINAENGLTTTIGEKNNPGAIASFDWTIPAIGNYYLKATANTPAGQISSSLITVYIRPAVAAPAPTITP